jgi:hypothetical protein
MLTSKWAKGKERSTLRVQSSALRVQGSAFDVRCLMFGVWRSAFGVQRLAHHLCDRCDVCNLRNRPNLWISFDTKKRSDPQISPITDPSER